MNQNKTKNEKSVPIETEYLTIGNIEKINSNQAMKERHSLIVGDLMLTGIEEKRISGNRTVKVQIFTGAKTQDMYDYLKPFLKKNSDNIILHIGTNNSVNETSRDILNEILSSKNFTEKFCPTRKVIVSNIYRSDNEKPL